MAKQTQSRKGSLMHDKPNIVTGQVILKLIKSNLTRGGIKLQQFLSYNKYFLHFQSSNRRSKPLDVISTIKCAWRPNFTFFLIFFYYLLRWVQKFNDLKTIIL